MNKSSGVGKSGRSALLSFSPRLPAGAPAGSESGLEYTCMRMALVRDPLNR
jgi:hypothetical protein